MSHATERRWFPQQTAPNAEQMKELEGRMRSLAQLLASPMGDQDSEEKGGEMF